MYVNYGEIYVRWSCRKDNNVMYYMDFFDIYIYSSSVKEILFKM